MQYLLDPKLFEFSFTYQLFFIAKKRDTDLVNAILKWFNVLN